jgi:5-phospho-D-xylono-1,4-lactonase
MDLRLHTVTGAIDRAGVAIVDGHTHVWIDDVGAAAADAPILNQADAIERELHDLVNVGVHLLVDCQPGGCGRNGQKLLDLSQKTGIHIVASTGFHLRRYYPASAPLFDLDATKAAQHFIRELTEGLAEAPTVKAGTIKAACESRFSESPRALFEGAVEAALATGCAIEVHTERGADAEAIVAFMLDRRLPPHKLILCHMDKRPDFALHRELTSAGILLEYDTFLRPKYQPEQHVWTLLPQMLEVGFEESLVLATDLADLRMWHHMGRNPGAVGLVTVVMRRLQQLGFSQKTVASVMGGNIIRAMAY